jgi:cellulose synthase operon protein YhjQ
MIVVAVISPKGGVGKTTIAANLSAAVATLGGKVRVIDLDPQNALRLHFGMQHDDPSGISRQTLLGHSWHEVMYRSQYGVDFLPYGVVNEVDRIAFEHQIEAQPYWLISHLETLNIGKDEVVFVDTPPGPTAYMQQVLHCANLAVVVLKPDAASYSTVPSMESLINFYCADRKDFWGSYYLINQMDASKQLNRDVYDMLVSSLGERLIPVAVHRDEAVSEALAYQAPVSYYSQHCSAAHDLQQVADWLQQRYRLVA